MSPIVYMPPIPHDCELPVKGMWQADYIAPKYPAGTIWECDECGDRWELDHGYYKVRLTIGSRNTKHDRIELVWSRIAKSEENEI